MENGPFIVDFPIKTSIYEGFSMAMLNNQRFFFKPFLPVFRACGSYHWLLESLGSLESPGDRCFWTMACHHCPERPARWCPSSLAKLVNITPIKPMVYGRYNELVNGVYKPTYNWGAPSCGEWWQSGRVAELVFLVDMIWIYTCINKKSCLECIIINMYLLLIKNNGGWEFITLRMKYNLWMIWVMIWVCPRFCKWALLAYKMATE